jgi:aldehyde dehydrogenase (NAD+)
MQRIEHIYINGAFVTPHGSEWFDLFNPATEEVIGQVRLGDADDVRHAIAAAKAAFPAFSRTSREQRLAMLQRMQAAMAAREDELFDAIVTEYGAPVSRARWMAAYSHQVIGEAAATLAEYAFEHSAGSARVVMKPLGVAGLITPWNSDAGFIC